MKQEEFTHILIAIIILAIVIGFTNILNSDFLALGYSALFAFIIIFISVLSKKTIARLLDSDVNHKIIMWGRYGFKPGWHFKKQIPLGILLPLIVTAFSLGLVKVMTILSYDTHALKRRAAKRFGFYSFTEMTDWHNALVGAAGILAVLLLSFISYWIPGAEPLARFSAFYAFWNMIPLHKFDGTQIFFGSKVLWYTLAIITLIFASYALFLP